ncbi:PIN domain-containing protein [Methylomonas sp. CM2]|uniref:PIN domain-containing protein n=1 Tax=Methylomonas sp. CM2 TaxID=3417647 RepID=UPI003CEAAFD9
MRVNSFIDTNIWVYAHFQHSHEKCAIALELIETLPALVGSTQVLNEYYSVMLKKKVNDRLIQDNIEVIISIAAIQTIQVTTIRFAHRLKLKYGFSYWDSLIVASALEADCRQLYSEDLQHGQVIEDRLTVINPFVNLQ